MCIIGPMATVSSTRTPADLALAVKKAVAALADLQKELGVSAPSYTAKQKRRTARFRTGGESVIATIANVATHTGTTVATLPLDEMKDLLAMATSVERLHLHVEKLDKDLSAFVFGARAAAWSTAMQYYALLQRMAKRNGNIAKLLEPVKKFMSVHDPRPRRVEGEPSRATQRAVKKAKKAIARLPPAAVDQAIAERAAKKKG